MSETWGAEKCEKGGFLGGFLARSASKMGGSWPKKAGKRRIFSRQRENQALQRDFGARLGHYVYISACPGISPEGN
jgi:hypothetical protein